MGTYFRLGQTPRSAARWRTKRRGLQGSTWSAFVFRIAVNPSLGRTHAFDGRPWMVAQGLREAWTVQRNAPSESFCAFAFLLCAKASGLPSMANPARRMRRALLSHAPSNAYAFQSPRAT